MQVTLRRVFVIVSLIGANLAALRGFLSAYLANDATLTIAWFGVMEFFLAATVIACASKSPVGDVRFLIVLAAALLYIVGVASTVVRG